MAYLKHALAGLILAAVAAGCAAKEKPKPPAPRVIVSYPLQRQVVDWDDYVGQFQAVNAVDVRPRVSGYIQSIAFKDGQNVRAGQLLFQIDPRPYEALVSQAQGQVAHATAALTDAKVELTRAKALLAAKATSQQDFDTRKATELQDEADLKTAQANLKTAQLNLAFTHVTAPISGRISDARATVGNLVTQDTTVLTSIVSLDPIRFTFEGPESLFLKYKREGASGHGAGGPPVQIRLQDEPTYRWSGRLEFVDNALDSSSGTIRARAIVNNPSLFLTPGMFGHMRLLGSQPYLGLLVPDQAIVQDQAREIVYVVDPKGVVAQRVVQTGPIIDGLRVIRSGIDASDRVVIDGVVRAHPGLKVTAQSGRITPVPDAAAAAPDTAPPAASATFAGVQ
jgi:RND family efflux transporter MFP subunit